MSTLALTMLNVVMIAGLANDPQQAFYGLSSVTYFAIGFILFFIPTALVSAELASGWPQRGGIFRWVGEGIGKGWAFTCLIILWFQSTFNLGAGMPNFAATIMNAMFVNIKTFKICSALTSLAPIMKKLK